MRSPRAPGGRAVGFAVAAASAAAVVVLLFRAAGVDLGPLLRPVIPLGGDAVTVPALAGDAAGTEGASEGNARPDDETDAQPTPPVAPSAPVGPIGP